MCPAMTTRCLVFRLRTNILKPPCTCAAFRFIDAIELQPGLDRAALEIERPTAQRSDRRDTDATNAAEIRSARTVSVENQSCSLQRETQCCEAERTENAERGPAGRAEKMGWSVLVQVAAATCVHPFCDQFRGVGEVGGGGSLCCAPQPEQPGPRWHVDDRLEAAESLQHEQRCAPTSGRLA